MKHTKRILALLLTLTLAFGVGVFAMAEEEIIVEQSALIEEEAAPAEEETDLPYVITSPKNLTIGNGRKFKLSVEVYVPEGWTLEYQWHTEHKKAKFDPPVITSASVILAAHDSSGYLGGIADFYCDITARNPDGIPFPLPQQYARITAKSVLPDWIHTLERSDFILRLTNSSVPSAVLGVILVGMAALPFLLIGGLIGLINRLLPAVS